MENPGKDYRFYVANYFLGGVLFLKEDIFFVSGGHKVLVG